MAARLAALMADDDYLLGARLCHPLMRTRLNVIRRRTAQRPSDITHTRRRAEAPEARTNGTITHAETAAQQQQQPRQSPHRCVIDGTNICRSRFAVDHTEAGFLFRASFEQ